MFGEDVDDPSTRVPPPTSDLEAEPPRQSEQPSTSGAASLPPVETSDQAEPTVNRNQSGDRLLVTYASLSDRYAKTKPAYNSPNPADDTLSRAYALGQADEGSACYAILAGEGLGGHRWDATAVAFHPRHRAVVTAGHDYSVRIWAVPESPAAEGDRGRTPLGFHPKLVSYPLFATNRLHEGGIDGIEW
jgi:WD40 repeat protein